MNSDSVKAYDLPERVRTYDADMDIMHPLRWKMIEVALEILPFHQTQSLRALDLGVGTGKVLIDRLDLDRWSDLLENSVSKPREAATSCRTANSVTSYPITFLLAA
ncbi:hypothetical protein MYX65_11005 [Acidobacteria bacterium AH-259-L09]|nr:hypothetical protein [Acidobacteria bacterium AH-259-L09]